MHKVQFVNGAPRPAVDVRTELSMCVNQICKYCNNSAYIFGQVTASLFEGISYRCFVTTEFFPLTSQRVNNTIVFPYLDLRWLSREIATIEQYEQSRGQRTVQYSFALVWTCDMLDM